jgi:molecular chaperone GrpE (heat shock protein)
LEEVRDELLFSLESSGIEQFRPDLKSEYRGLEKSTEVIKEREPAPKPKLKGLIAKIVRAGYQYCLNEDKIKVVRTAQVKIYD